MASKCWVLVCVAAAGVAAAGGTSGKRTAITVWTGSAAPAGGASYGGFTAPTGALIVEHREVDVAASGELKIAGVATTVDPASVQLKTTTDPNGFAITQQRFIPGATTPTEILSRHVGEPVSGGPRKRAVTGVPRPAAER